MIPWYIVVSHGANGRLVRATACSWLDPLVRRARAHGFPFELIGPMSRTVAMQIMRLLWREIDRE